LADLWHLLLILGAVCTTTALASLLLGFAALIEHLGDVLGTIEGAHERPEHLLLLGGFGTACLTKLALECLVLTFKQLKSLKKLSFLI